MGALLRAIGLQPRKPTPREVTLLELVSAVAEVTNDEREIRATVLHMLRTGSVRLCGCFRGTPVEELADVDIAECICADAERASLRRFSAR